MDAYRRNELPYTYDRCKTFTDEFTGWLTKTAEARGIEYQTYLDNHAHERYKKRKTKPKVPIQQLVKIAQKIAESGKAPEDTSGLDSLSRAISARKEVTSWFVFNGISDEGHPHFTKRLIDIQGILQGLFRNVQKEHDLAEEVIPVIITYMPLPGFPGFEEESDDDEDTPATKSESRMPETSSLLRQNLNKKNRPLAQTKEDVAMESNFMVLCFLYDSNLLRTRIRKLWSHYHSQEIGVMAAAVLTDLAQGTVQRNVAAILTELERSTEERSLAEIVKQLFEIASATGISESQTQGQSGPKDVSPKLADLFCIEAIRHMEEFQRLKTLPPSEIPGDFSSRGLPHMVFLLFFDRFQTRQLNPPLVDNFTKAMQSSTTGSEPWLPFGLQIMLDLQTIIKDQDDHVYTEVTEGYIELIKLMRAHIDYEDRMWAIGMKPEYMTVGETKFSNSFLRPASDILTWFRQILDDGRNSDGKGFVAIDFISRNPVLSGLVLYHFHRIYHTVSISKTQWFVVSFAHLYNACRQVGGLSTPWPDLEFIIETHSAKRIFVGDRPTDPQDFYHRFLMGMCISARSFQGGFAQRNLRYRKADPKTKEKRGLSSFFPLQKKIFDYYYNNRSDNRWITLHNLFAYMLEGKDAGHAIEKSTSATANDVRTEFASILESLKPKKSRNNRRKKSTIKVPDLPAVNIHAELLGMMEDTLRDNELHSNFDYLAWYRRAFAFVQHIRGDVLFDSTQELMKLNMEDENPDNFQLLCNLLEDLRIQPKDSRIEVKGDEISKDVVALEQLQKISTVMEDLIRDEGRVELDNAEKLLGRWWDAPEPPPKPRTLVLELKGVFHKHTYSATVSRKRRSGFIRHKRGPLLSFKPSKQRPSTSRLIGKKKRNIHHRCLGLCSLARSCLGRPRKNQKQSFMMKYPVVRRWLKQLETAKQRARERHPDWATASDLSNDEWDDALEYWT